MKELVRNKWLVGGTAAAFVGVLALAIVLLGGLRAKYLGATSAQASQAAPAPEDPKTDPEDGEPTPPVAIAVKTVRPKRNASLEVTVEQPAYVEGYYHADLLARVAGPVTFLEKSIGDKVEANEELIRIDVPDLKQDVEQKKTVVAQR